MFETCKTIEELTAAYRKAAMKNHPDMGGTDEAMKAVNAEFSAMFARLKDAAHMASKVEGNAEDWEDIPANLAEIIAAIIAIPGIEIEICGTWLWVRGDTYPHRVELRDAGLKYSGKRKAWYFAPATSRRHYASNASMDDIRAAYGSKKVEGKARKGIEAA